MNCAGPVCRRPVNSPRSAARVTHSPRPSANLVTSTAGGRGTRSLLLFIARQSTGHRNRHRIRTAAVALRRDGSRCTSLRKHPRSRRHHTAGNGGRAHSSVDDSGSRMGWVPRIVSSTNLPNRMPSHGSCLEQCASASRSPSRTSAQKRTRASMRRLSATSRSLFWVMRPSSLCIRPPLRHGSLYWRVNA